MAGGVVFHPDFDPEFDALAPVVQDDLLAHAKLLEPFRPTLRRPRADTLKGSRHANMKELRFTADGGVWRVAFAFDPERKAVLLIAADKSAVAERRLYRRLIGKADERFDRHLDRLERPRGGRDEHLDGENGPVASRAPEEGRGTRPGADCRGDVAAGPAQSAEADAGARRPEAPDQSGERVSSRTAQRSAAPPSAATSRPWAAS